MTDQHILHDIRKKLAKLNKVEIISKEDQPALQEMWEKMQDLREEMNAAKKAASFEAAKPYLELILEIEKRYAVLLRLTTS